VGGSGVFVLAKNGVFVGVYVNVGTGSLDPHAEINHTTMKNIAVLQVKTNENLISARLYSPPENNTYEPRRQLDCDGFFVRMRIK
jgi:hypothetical protein